MRIHFFILFTVFCVFQMKSQIQRNIFESVIGVSSKTLTISNITKRGFEVRNYLDHGQPSANFYDVIGEVSFGGAIWDNTRVRFVNGKFASIAFLGNISPSQFASIKNKLLSKYSKYLQQNSSLNNDVLYFNDGVIDISFFYFNKSTNTAYLMYSSDKLIQKHEDASTLNDL